MNTRTRRQPGWKSCGGWTAVEITVVAGLVAMVAAATLPAINRNLEQFRLDTAIYALSSDLQSARILALKRNTSVTVSIDVNRCTWTVAGGSERNLSRSVSFGVNSPAAVTFDSRGRSTSVGTQIITINNSESQARTINILSSGKVTVN